MGIRVRRKGGDEQRLRAFLALALLAAAGCAEPITVTPRRLSFIGGGWTTHFGRTRDSGEPYNSSNEALGLRWESPVGRRFLVGAAALAFENSNYDPSWLAGLQGTWRLGPLGNADIGVGITLAIVSGYREHGGDLFLFAAPVMTLSFRDQARWWQRLGLVVNCVPDYGGEVDPSMTLLLQFTLYEWRSRHD